MDIQQTEADLLGNSSYLAAALDVTNLATLYCSGQVRLMFNKPTSDCPKRDLPTIDIVMFSLSYGLYFL